MCLQVDAKLKLPLSLPWIAYDFINRLNSRSDLSKIAELLNPGTDIRVPLTRRSVLCKHVRSPREEPGSGSQVTCTHRCEPRCSLAEVYSCRIMLHFPILLGV